MTGMLTITCESTVLKLEYWALASAKKSLVGCLVVMLIAPPTELRPKYVPCGPRNTSMRSMSTISGFEVPWATLNSSM